MPQAQDNDREEGLGFGYDVSVRPPICTDAGEGGRESEVSPSGEEHVIAEVKFCISNTSLVSAVNQMHRLFSREREKKTSLSLH